MTDVQSFLNHIRVLIHLNRGAGTSELLKDKNTNDLDEKELNRCFKMERVVRSFGEEGIIVSDLPIQKRLIYLGLAENGHIFKGTFLCLGKRNQIQTISQSATESKFIVFKGTNRANILSLETLNGSIIQQYEKMMMLLRTHIPLGRDREKSEDIYEIPMVAIREFTANAFIHRDYNHSVQSYIQVELYDDRLEIKSPGHLPSTVNVNSIEGTVLTNPSIAAIFYLYKHIERAGTGINVAQGALQEYGLRAATIENIDNPKMVKVTIHRQRIQATAGELAAWQNAVETNTLYTYARFLRNFPNSKFAEQAEEQLNELEEAAFWQEVVAKNTLLMYNRYLRNYPDGIFAEEANKRLDALENP